MYNLDEQFSNLSTKQIEKMIKSRINKYHQASESLEPLEIILQRNSDYPKIQARVDNIKSVMFDIDDWMSAAHILFSKKCWDNMVDN